MSRASSGVTTPRCNPTDRVPPRRPRPSTDGFVASRPSMPTASTPRPGIDNQCVSCHTVIHFFSAFVDALDKAHRTRSHSPRRATSITGRIDHRDAAHPQRRERAGLVRAAWYDGCEKRAKSLSPRTPRSAQKPPNLLHLIREAIALPTSDLCSRLVVCELASWPSLFRSR